MKNEEMEKIRAVMSKAFPNSEIPKDIEHLMYGSFDEWDSLGNFALLMLVEQEFGIEFSMKDLSEIRSIADLMARLGTN